MKRMIGKPCVKEDNRSLGMILGKCEFVGGEVKIEKCSTDSMVGMQGIIIKETRNYFTIVNDKSKTKSESNRQVDSSILFKYLSFSDTEILLRVYVSHGKC